MVGTSPLGNFGSRADRCPHGRLGARAGRRQPGVERRRVRPLLAPVQGQRATLRPTAAGPVPSHERCPTATGERRSALAPATNQLSGRLSRLRMHWSDVTVSKRLSPSRVDLLEEEATIFATGSPAYTLASSVIESAFTGIGGFTADFSSIFIPGQELFPSPTPAIVQRRIHPKTGQCAFYAAGFSTLGTSAAGRYLFTHWKSLFKTYGSSEPFTVVLEVRGESPGRPAVVFESSAN